jgi:adenylate cyclase
MVDGTTGGHLWAERYDRDVSDIFAVQDEVTRSIVGALKVKLTEGEEEQRRGRANITPEAYELLVRARQIMLQLRPEGAVEARTLLEQVVALGSGAAVAYARLSMITFAEFANRWNNATAENLTRAMELAEKAIEADSTEPQGHIARSLVLSWLRRLDEAEPAAERAVQLDPNSPDGYTALGNVRDFQGRHEEAVALFTRAYRLDPQWTMALHFMGRALLALGRFDEAEIAFKKRLTVQPNSDMSRFYLACLYARAGRYEEARRYWRETLDVNPNFSVEHLRGALPYRDPAVFDRLVDALREADIPV